MKHRATTDSPQITPVTGRTLQDNPSEIGQVKADRVRVSYRYGAARAALLYGLDLEGTIGNVFVRAHYSINGKYKQYPTIPKEQSRI